MFFQEFVKNPAKVGALFPSSMSLASEMMKRARITDRDVIVEFGAGTGVFTEMICDQKKDTSTFLSFEISDTLYKLVAKKCPKAHIYKDSAVFTQKYLHKHGHARCDCIVSSLPFSLFGAEMQDECIDVIDHSLDSTGVFVTFIYAYSCNLPLAKRFIKKLKKRFLHVQRSPIIWKNLPPAYVFTAKNQ